MRRKTLAAMVLVPALALGLPACGAKDKKADAKASQASDLEKMRAYARCMRANGVDMADPESNGQGGVGIKVKGHGPQAQMDKTMKAAEAKCRHLMPNGGKPRKPKPEELAKMRAFAKCMREHGIDMPDPDPNGGITFRSRKGKGGSNGLPNQGPDSPAFKNAQKACNQYAPNGGKGPGLSSGKEGALR